MAAWLDIVTEATGWNLVDTGRLEKLVEGLSHPETQYPSLIWFAGNGNRIKALQALFPHNNITRSGPAGLARLHVSTETANRENPVLFAETNLFNDSEVGKTNLSHSSTERFQRHHILQKGTRSLAEIRQHVITNVLFAWTQVLCFFVNAPSEMQKVLDLLESPRRKVRIGSRSIPGFTRVIIVLTCNQHPEASDATAKVFSQYLNGDNQMQVTILDLRNRLMLSPKAAFEPLRRVILDQIQISRTEHIQQGLSLSGLHLCSLWDRTLELEMARPGDLSLSLDCLQVARESHRMNLFSADHLVRFLDHADSLGCNTESIHIFVASALLLNAYPPGMHCFRHEDVFDDLYRSQCWKAWNTRTGLDPSENCNSIMAHMGHLSREMSPARSSASIRRTALNDFYHKWKGLYSTTTCFLCLCRSPEHMLPCHHAICDTCVVIFGLPSQTAEYHFDIPHCPICRHGSQLAIRQLPPTKLPVLLSLDGGGIRGIIQLGLLQSLEKRLGNKISLPQIFDHWTCTSAGALNGMDIVFNESTAGQSFGKFPGFARKAFHSRPSPLQGTSIIKCTRWLKCLAGFLADGQYDGKNLENVLKDALSSNRRLFDFGTTSGSNSRVAIIASRISDGKACVMANYRGAGLRPVEGAYLFLEPQDHNKDPFLWEAARCSVAAPWFFRTKTLPGFGPLQDGGVRANNPVAIALKESAVIWPAAGRHDLLVSVGTGYTASSPGNEASTSGNIFKDGAVPRLFRAAMSSPSMDGEQGFYEALNFVPDHMRENIYRLNHAVTCPLPRLDDVDKLEELERLTYTVPDDLVRAVLVTGCYFFEIDQTPVPKNGSYFCQGSVLCRNSQPRDLLKRVIEEFPGGQFQTARGHPLGLLDEDDGCHVCGYYRKKVAFHVKSLEEMVTIEVASSSSRRKVGGFPRSVQEVLDNQQAFARFGRPDHSMSTWPPPRKCFCLRGTRRLVQFLEPPLNKKKRRL